jgi:flavin-dependent dehydrogenase
MVHSYDLAVVGAGPAGRSAAEVAAVFGRRALVVERMS